MGLQWGRTVSLAACSNPVILQVVLALQRVEINLLEQPWSNPACVQLLWSEQVSRMLSGEARDKVSSLQPAQRPCSVLLWRTNASPDTHIPLPQVEARQCRNYRGNAMLQEPRVLLLHKCVPVLQPRKASFEEAQIY